MESKYAFFWGGPFSQWITSPFTINGETFNCCEQWMMWNKAMMFGDIEIAEQIMATRDPRIQKALGRKVKNFNDDVWMEKAFEIVVEGNHAKFTQNADCMKALVESKGKIIVEASPQDIRWGIGMGAGDAGIEDPANWKGQNLLGEAIMVVRRQLLGE